MANKSALGDFSFPVVFGLVESAANTLTFEKIDSGVSVTDRVGWILERMEIHLPLAVPLLFNSSGDGLEVGLSSNGTLSTLALDNPSIKALFAYERFDFGTAANAVFTLNVIQVDYSSMSGGGILMLPNPLYGFIQGTGLSAAASANLKCWFKAYELTDSDYFNLVQSAQLILSN